MELFNSLAQWYSDYSDAIPMVLTAGFVLVILGVVLFFSKDKLIHGVAVAVAAGVFFVLSVNTSVFGEELYLNLSAALLLALLTWLFSWLAVITEGWLMSIGLAVVTGLALLVFVNPDEPRTSLFLTIPVGLTGAVGAAFLIREDWEWSPQRRGQALREAIRKERKANRKREGGTGDYYILIVGRDAADAAQKLQFLHDSSISTYDEQPPAYDSETGLTFQQVQGNIVTTVKDEEVVFLNNQEARLRLLAYPDSGRRIYQQLTEVLEITSKRRIEWHSEELVHLELRATTPQVLFSRAMEKQILALAQGWRESEDEALHAAIEPLLEWGRRMQFIKA